MEVGEKIRKYRKARGYTQKELAEAVNIPLATLQRYERGESAPTLERVNDIARELEIFNFVFWRDEEDLIIIDSTPLTRLIDKFRASLLGLGEYVQIAIDNENEKVFIPDGENIISISPEVLRDCITQSYDLLDFLISTKGTPESMPEIEYWHPQKK